MSPERRAIVLCAISGIGVAGIAGVATRFLASHLFGVEMALGAALYATALLVPGSAALGILLSHLANRPSSAPLVPIGVMALLGFFLAAFHVVILGAGIFLLHWSIVFLRSSRYTPAEGWGGIGIFMLAIVVGILYAPSFSLFAILMAALQRRWPNNALQRTRHARR